MSNKSSNFITFTEFPALGVFADFLNPGQAEHEPGQEIGSGRRKVAEDKVVVFLVEAVKRIEKTFPRDSGVDSGEGRCVSLVHLRCTVV